MADESIQTTDEKPKYSDAKIIKYLRTKAKAEGLLSEKYDKKYNLLRWAISENYDITAAKNSLLRHLRFRRALDLDHINEWHNPDEVSAKYFPLGLVGGTGKDNRMLVIEAAGKADLHGITNSITCNQLIMSRMAFQERLLARMNEAEESSGKRSGTVYIIDLDGLSMDPSLVSVVSGQYRMLWELIFMNYPEWVSVMYVINAPSFMKVLWAALTPFIPETTAKKIQILGTPDQWQPILLEQIAADHLPVYWGGTLVDETGDTMCRSRIIVPSEPVPERLYWKPSDEAPDHNSLSYIGIGAGDVNVLSVQVDAHVDRMTFVRWCDRAYVYSVRYDSDSKVDPTTLDPKKSTIWQSPVAWGVLTSTDSSTIHVAGAGTYHLIFSNEDAWIRTLWLYYRIRFSDSASGLVVQPTVVENRAYADRYLDMKEQYANKPAAVPQETDK